jgi:hypothetical protein
MLSWYESLHLVRNLPFLGAWLADDFPLSTNALGSSRREVALTVLNAWQGHPQLLTYADIAINPLGSLPSEEDIADAAGAAKVSAGEHEMVPDAGAIREMLHRLTELRAGDDLP